MKKARYIAYGILALHTLVIILNHVLGYIGHYGVDDLHYSELARNLNDGLIDYNDHSTYRYTLIYLTAWAYQLFGISDFSSSLPAIIVSISILFLLFFTLKRSGNIILSLGLSLCTFSTWFIFYSDKLMPDIYVALFALLSLHFYRLHQQGEIQNRSFLFALGMVLSLLLGFLSKGTIILLIPLFVFLFVTDLLRKNNLKFWLYAGIQGVVMLAIYFGSILWATGDINKRFHAIQGNSYVNACSYNLQPLEVLLSRISIGFVKMILYQGMMIPFIFIFAYIFATKIKKWKGQNNVFSFYLTASIILFFSANFMTISLSFYNPMCLDPRHYLFLIPIAAIPSAMILHDFLRNRSHAMAVVLMSVAVAVASFFLAGKGFQLIYLPITIALIVFTIVKSKKITPLYKAVILTALLLLHPTYSFRYARKIDYPIQRELVLTNILEQPGEAYIIGNAIQTRLGKYYQSFVDDHQKIFVSFDKFDPNEVNEWKDAPVYLIRNWYTSVLSQQLEGDLPHYATDPSYRKDTLSENADIHLYLYQLNDRIKNEKQKTIRQSLNTMESKEIPFWSQPNNLVTDPVFEGKHSMSLTEFSASFNYSTDDLLADNYDAFILSGHVQVFFEEAHEAISAVIVLSLEDDKGVYSWQSVDVNRYVKAYTTWWQVPFETYINRTEIKPRSTLKIYIWNQDHNKGFVDNFEVKISGMKLE